jgi:hypothetical protein
MNDGRAVSTCNLGPLISAEIAANDSLQENGLIKYKGNAELSGLFRPALGTVVTFEYTMGGITRSVPKKMRVLSSFANPLTRTTSVELGCLLTYKSDLREPEKLDTEIANRDYTGQTIWLNNPAIQAAYAVSWGNTTTDVDDAYWSSGYKRVGASISAKWAFRYCLEKLGITASSNPLTNKFRLQEFDFSSGWVQVMSDLLQSESYIGELDEDEVLQIRTLTDETGAGPVIFTTDLQSVSPINAGGIPASSLGVEYKAWRFNSTPDPNQSSWTAGFGVAGGQGITAGETTVEPDDSPGWEFSEQTGPQTRVAVRWETPSGADQLYETSYTPSTISRTSYITIGGKRYPRETTQVRGSILSAEAADYAAAALKAGVFSEAAVQSKDVTTYEYNSNGEKTAEVREKYEPAVAVAGSTNMGFWFPDGVVSVSASMMRSEMVRVDYYHAGDSECQVTTKWQTWMHSQAGQQAAASSNQRTKTRAKAEEFLNNVLTGGLYLIGQTTEISVRSNQGKEASKPVPATEGVSTQTNTFKPGFPGRTSVANSRLSATSFDYRSKPPSSDSAPVEESSQITWIYGDADEERRTTLTMPYNDDDEVIPLGGFGWKINRGTAQEKANRYGRAQNRLTYGYRNGMEIQMNPVKMPDHAFAPIYLSIDGLVAQYRVNNPSWVLTAGEAVASCNAIYWGVVGTS